MWITPNWRELKDDLLSVGLRTARRIGAAGKIGTADAVCAASQTRSDNVAASGVGGHHGKAAAPPGAGDIPHHVPGPGRLAGVAMDRPAAVHGGPAVDR